MTHKPLSVVLAILAIVTMLGAESVAQEQAPTPLIAGVQVDVHSQTMTIMGLNLGAVSGGSLALAELTLTSIAPNAVTAVLPAYPPGTYLLALHQSDGTLSNLFYLTLGAVVSQGAPATSSDTPAADGGLLMTSTASAPGHRTESAIDATDASPSIAADHAGTTNIHFGGGSLAGITSGEYNAAIGYNALHALTVGNYNNAIGAYALQALTTGVNNFALGTSALQVLATDNGNTSIGDFTLSNLATGPYNVAVGQLSLHGLASGQYNTAIGTSALRNVTTGSFNIAIGGNAGSGVSAGSNNIHIGHLGEAADSNVIRIGSGQVGTYLAGTVHATAFSGDGSALTGVTAVYQ